MIVDRWFIGARCSLLAGAIALGIGTLGCGGSAAGGYLPDGGSPDAKQDAKPAPDGGVNCHVALIPQAPASFDGLTAGPSAKLRVRGQVTGLPAAGYTWSWNVLFADGQAIDHTQPVATDPGLIEFSLATAGSYTILVSLVGGPMFCGGEQTVVATPANPKLASFRFHIAPPPGGDPAQEQELQIVGGTPTGGNKIALTAGTLVPFRLLGAGGKPVAGYLRVTDAAGRVTAEVRVDSGGTPTSLKLPTGTYDLLVVPDDDSLAPVLLTTKSPAQLAAMFPLTVDGGIVVRGQVSDAGGAVSGARVVLRAGPLPSTAGVTAANGQFTLHAAAATYGMTVTRAEQASSRSMEVIVPAMPGIPISAAAAPPPLNVQMAAIDTTTLSVTVQGYGGGSAPTGTRMVLTTAAPIDGLATVTLGTEQRPAGLRVRAEAIAATDGSVTIAALPRAHYRATVVPGVATGQDGITTIAEVNLTVDGGFVPMFSLLRKVRLTGKLLPAALAGNTPITAVDLGDVPVAIPGVADANGVWSLLVNPVRQYTLRAQPQAGQMLARAVFGPVAVPTADVSVADRMMPAALLYSGTLVDHALQALGGASIQVYCLAGTGGCADPETPVAETTTRSDGHFDLFVPDPGLN